jgi:phospholipid/cholesterol/gamma-HCH transport system substrate-binding protein
MAGKVHPVRLGVFIFFGMSLVVLAIFLIGNRESMFSKTFNVKAYFNNIEGLRKGAQVRFSGIDVGSVKDVQIVNNSLGHVEVSIKLISEVKKYLGVDTKVTIETEGLVGNKVVTLIANPNSTTPIYDGAIIQGVDPMGFGAIIEETKGTLENTRSMTKNLAEILAKVNDGEGTVGRLINDASLYNNTTQLMRSADKSFTSISQKLDTVSVVANSLMVGVQSIISNVDKMVLNVDEVVTDVKKGKGLLGQIVMDNSDLDKGFSSVLGDLVKITQHTKAGAEKFEENMEALKRNWLFKGYYEQRGYYDKTGYEKELDTSISQINDRIKMLDDRIETLKKLQNQIK